MLIILKIVYSFGNNKSEMIWCKRKEQNIYEHESGLQ